MAESRARVRLCYREAEAAMVDLAGRTGEASRHRQGPEGKVRGKEEEEEERTDKKKEVWKDKKLPKEAKGRKQIGTKVAGETEVPELPPLPEEAELFLKAGVVGQVVEEVGLQGDSATGKIRRKRRSKEEREKQKEETLQKRIEKKEVRSAERLEKGKKKTEAIERKKQEKKEAREAKKSSKEVDRRKKETEKKGALQRENEKKYAKDANKVGKWGVVPCLPPLPEEAALFEASEPVKEGEVCRALVEWLDSREEGEVAEVHQVAAALQVEVRKLFACYSVLEGLGMVERVGSTTSSTYVWRGRGEVEQRLASLYQAAVEEGVLDRLDSSGPKDTPAPAPTSPHLGAAVEDGSEVQEQENPQHSGDVEEGLKEKLTMGALTQQLLKVFLVSPVPRRVTMAAVARVAGARGLRVVARLVRACKVLAELGLVQEVQADPTIPNTRATAFQYLGPVVGEVVEEKMDVEDVAEVDSIHPCLP